MSQLSLNLYEIPFEELFKKIRNQNTRYSYDYSKHHIRLVDKVDDNLGIVRLPLHLTLDSDLIVLKEQSLILYLSIESGHASICVMEGKKNIYHTTFSAYMTRKKQGVSQIKYLNKKGKSRAGSRVRLAKTLEFFENINATLNTLFDEYQFDRIAMNCSTTLIPYLYKSKVECPFDKKDSRLYKIPVHIPQSNYTNLDKAIKKLMAPMVFYDSTNELEVSKIFL